MLPDLTPAFLHALTVKVSKDDPEVRAKHIVLRVRIEPLTEDVVGALSPGLAAHLFDGDPVEVATGKFPFYKPATIYSLALRMAKDMEPSAYLDHVEFEPMLTVRRDSETDAYSGNLSIVCTQYTPEQVHVLVSGVSELWYLSLVELQQELPLEDEEPRAKPARRRRGAARDEE